jgi:hypothetical protein
MARDEAGYVSESDWVRHYVYRNYIVPARAIKAASITVIARDVYKALQFKDRNRMGLVCDALGALKFQAQSGIRLLQRSGRKHGANATFTFSI